MQSAVIILYCTVPYASTCGRAGPLKKDLSILITVCVPLRFLQLMLSVRHLLHETQGCEASAVNDAVCHCSK